MNKIEKILDSHIDGGPGAYKGIYDELEEYIKLTVKRHLEMASENAKIKTCDYDMNELVVPRKNICNDHTYHYVDEKSITEIKIDL